MGVNVFLFCEELSYNGQRRRDVPDLATGTLYIDVGDRSVRRKRQLLLIEEPNTCASSCSSSAVAVSARSLARAGSIRP